MNAVPHVQGFAFQRRTYSLIDHPDTLVVHYLYTKTYVRLRLLSDDTPSFVQPLFILHSARPYPLQATAQANQQQRFRRSSTSECLLIIIISCIISSSASRR